MTAKEALNLVNNNDTTLDRTIKYCDLAILNSASIGDTHCVVCIPQELYFDKGTFEMFLNNYKDQGYEISVGDSIWYCMKDDSEILPWSYVTFSWKKPGKISKAKSDNK